MATSHSTDDKGTPAQSTKKRTRKASKAALAPKESETARKSKETSEDGAKPKKQTKPAQTAARTDSMAAFMDALLLRTTDPKELEAELGKEAQKRGVKAPTLGTVRGHIRYRQARGQLQGVKLPELPKIDKDATREAKR